jgi:hypothetical protein
MYRRSCLGNLLGSKRRSKPSKTSDRSASLRTCFPTASGRQSFPRSAGSAASAQTRTTLGSSVPLPRVAGQSPSLSHAVDEVTGSTAPRRPARNQQSPVGTRRQLNGARSASSPPPRGCGEPLPQVSLSGAPCRKSIGTARTGDTSPAGGSRQMLRRIAASFTRTATVPLGALTVP